jgi:hypothetical protein
VSCEQLATVLDGIISDCMVNGAMGGSNETIAGK